MNPWPYCANDGTCACAKFHDNPEGCERRAERGISPIRDEIVNVDLAELEKRLPEQKVIVLGGDGYSSEGIAALLAGKVGADQYEVITHAEAGERGLLIDDIGEPVRLLDPPVPSWRQPPARPQPTPNPERDAWNAAVEQRKADKRRAKGKP